MTDTSRLLVLELTCPLAASPERIFNALTAPAHLAKWWGIRILHAISAG